VSKKKLAKVFYADLWGKRKNDKYPYLLNNDVNTTKWQELKPVAPYYFFVPKDFSLQKEYDRFFKVTEIFNKWSYGAVTSRDSLVVGFTIEEIVQRMNILTGHLSDDLIKKALNIKDTKTWKLKNARLRIKNKILKNEIYKYDYRPFDTRYVCYIKELIERSRLPFMNNMKKDNIALIFMREVVIESGFSHIFICSNLIDARMQLSNRGATYFLPLYIYTEKHIGENHELPLQNDKFKGDSETNFTSVFLEAIYESLGKEPIPEDIFFYIYAVLYSPTYRKRYEEFLKIDFPRIPLPSNFEYFQEMSNLGKELADLHLLKHSSLYVIEVGFQKSGSNTVEKVRYDEKSRSVYINKEQYFENIDSKVWIYKIGAYQVMEKYLKDRKKRKLTLDELNHYMKVAKSIKLTIQIQGKIDEVFCK